MARRKRTQQSQAASIRWSKASKLARSEHARMMTRAREAKRAAMRARLEELEAQVAGMPAFVESRSPALGALS